MSKDIRALEPIELWNNFADLNAVPRGSKKEEKVIQFMVDFGKKLNLETVVDHVGNVIIKKPATEGMEDRLVQVFRNLLANAITFSPKGGTIKITAASDGDDIIITVSDNGPGITPGKEAAIFDRFYTERPLAEKFGTHSGLGLAISKQIIDAYGGQITAENALSEAGEIAGARFIVRLEAA